jgi:dCTP deaminase
MGNKSMSLLTYTELCEIVEQGVIQGVEPGRINAASIDVTLGDTLLREDWTQGVARKTVDLAAKQTPSMVEVDLKEAGSYELKPGEFVLASTRELFFLPNDLACEFKLKSSLARSGIQHAVAGWADPGFNGSVLTLELSNSLRSHWLVLRPSMPIGQLVFFRGQPVPEHASYKRKGQYNGDAGTQASRGVR